MIKKPITINLSTGLEARPVAQRDICRDWKEKGKCKEHHGYDDSGT